jgi:hypothetical protein
MAAACSKAGNPKLPMVAGSLSNHVKRRSSPMPNSDFQTLVSKVMSDDAFAANLTSNPEQTLKAAGIEPTGELLDALNGADVASIKQMASSFKQGQAAAS